MSVQQTSIDSYREAKDNGLITRRGLQIVEYMHAANRPVSQRDIQRAFNDTSSSFHPRFCELERAGAIKCVGEKQDEITSRQVKIYVIGAAPTKKQQPVLTAKAILKELLRDYSIDDFVFSVMPNARWSHPKVQRYIELIRTAREICSRT
jgi:hypothetical protein